MVGITLGSEQILRAPPEVRRWIEHEVATSLGLHVTGVDSQRQMGQLAACTHDDVTAMLSSIQGVFPVVNVFFELGRKGTSCAQDRLQAYRLADIQLHTRLQSTDQVLSCLNLLDEAFRQTRSSAGVSFYGADGGYCFVATETQQNIHRLWLELIGQREMTTAAAQTPAGDGSAVGASPRENDRPAAFPGSDTQAAGVAAH